MTVPIPDVSRGLSYEHSRVARWSVGLSAVFAVSIVAAAMTYAIGSALSGQDAVEDNWVAVLVSIMAFAGLLASLVAFVFAIVAKIRHERWTLLWVPMCAFLVAVAFLVLGEVFWWE